VNVLKPHLRITIETLLRAGASQREIQRRTGVDRKTIRHYAGAANSPTPATGSEGLAQQTPPPRPPVPEELFASEAVSDRSTGPGASVCDGSAVVRGLRL
jgi:transposase